MSEFIKFNDDYPFAAKFEKFGSKRAAISCESPRKIIVERFRGLFWNADGQHDKIRSLTAYRESQKVIVTSQKAQSNCSSSTVPEHKTMAWCVGQKNNW